MRYWLVGTRATMRVLTLRLLPVFPSAHARIRRPPVDGRFWDVLRHVVRDHVDVAVSKWQREELPKVISRALSQAMDRVLDDPTLLNARQ